MDVFIRCAVLLRSFSRFQLSHGVLAFRKMRFREAWRCLALRHIMRLPGVARPSKAGTWATRNRAAEK